MSKAKGGVIPQPEEGQDLWWVIGVAVVVTAALIVASTRHRPQTRRDRLPGTILTDQERGVCDRHVLRGAPTHRWNSWESGYSRCPHCRTPTWPRVEIEQLVRRAPPATSASTCW